MMISFSRTFLSNLIARRDCLIVVHVFKILVGLSSAPNVFIPLVRIQDASITERSTPSPFSRLKLCLFHLGYKLRNKLPENVASHVTLPAFEAAVKAIVMD